MPAATRKTTRKTLPQTAYLGLEPKSTMSTVPKPMTSKRVSRANSKTASTSKPHSLPPALKRPRKRDVDAAAAAAAARKFEEEEAERSKQMRLEWEAIIAKHPPCKALAPKDLPRPGQPTPPPHRLYGWPFTEEYLLDYARRHRLEFPVCSAVRARFEGKEEYNFGDLTDDHLADGVLVQHLQRVATTRVRRHFIQAGASVDIDRPLSLKWDSMFVLWSTRDFEPKYRMYKMFKNWDKVKKFVDDALNECLPEGCERRTSLEWWWSLENAFARKSR